MKMNKTAPEPKKLLNSKNIDTLCVKVISQKVQKWQQPGMAKR